MYRCLLQKLWCGLFKTKSYLCGVGRYNPDRFMCDNKGSFSHKNATKDILKMLFNFFQFVTISVKQNLLCMKKLFFFLAVLSFYTASSQWYSRMGKCSLRNLDGRNYRVVDMGSTTYLFRTTTWEADTSKTNLQGQYLSEIEINERMKWDNTPPVRF